MNHEHFLTGNLPALNVFSALHCGEEVVDIQLVKDFLTDAIRPADALDNTGGVPGNIDVNNGASAVQVKAF